MAKTLQEVEEFLTEMKTPYEKRAAASFFKGILYNQEILITVPDGLHTISYFFENEKHGVTAITYRDSPGKILTVI